VTLHPKEAVTEVTLVEMIGLFVTLTLKVQLAVLFDASRAIQVTGVTVFGIPAGKYDPLAGVHV
jgi:hypothetical protein